MMTVSIIVMTQLEFTEAGRGCAPAGILGSVLRLILRVVGGVCKWGQGWGGGLGKPVVQQR